MSYGLGFRVLWFKVLGFRVRLKGIGVYDLGFWDFNVSGLTIYCLGYQV